MKTILALLLSMAVPLGGENRTTPKPDSARGQIDFRDVVGIVPHGAGTDVYWERTNEFETPTRSRLMKTTVSPDGTSRLSRVLIKEFDEYEGGSRVDGEGTNVQAIWKDPDNIVASPVVNGALKYPEGKYVSFGNYADLICHASECAVIYTVGSTQHATFLDADSNVAGSVTLPAGFHPLSVSFSEQGLFFVRHQLKELRAALVRRDGSVQYDIAIADADAAAFEAGPVAIAENGNQHVVAFVDYAPEPVEVHAVTISGDGTMSEPVRLLQAAPSIFDHPSNVSTLSLAWNGTIYVLGYVSGGSFLRRYDSAFHPIDAAPQRASDGAWASIQADGERFLIAWLAAKPYLTILSPNGEMTPKLELDPMPRRRAVR